MHIVILLVVLPFIYAELNIKSHCINRTRIRIDMKIYTLQITFTFSHLADAFIQSDLQIRKLTKTIS